MRLHLGFLPSRTAKKAHTHGMRACTQHACNVIFERERARAREREKETWLQRELVRNYCIEQGLVKV